MGKKKNRQNSSSVIPIDPSESSDAAVVAKPARKTACPHFLKSVDPNALRKNFRGNGHLANRDCSECKKQNISSVVEDIWLCLRCGSCTCGPERKNHGLFHFETPRSDSHSLAVKLETSVVWCYDCKVEVPAECSQKLYNSIEFIKQLRDTKKLAGPTIKKSNNSQDCNQNVATVNGQLKNNFKISSPNKQTSLSTSAKIKGLTNLGNTCFFNSVLQCLAQTPGLIKILQEMQEPGQIFELHLDDGDTLKGELCKGGPVSESLLELLTDMTKSDSGNGVLVPRKLLAAFRRKCPQFEDGDQNDAHELLRHLLDVVHTEDLRRYQRIILEANGLQSSVNPVEVAEDKKKRVKRLNQKVSEAVTIRPDQIFKGTLVSQLQCQTCSHKSDCLESFLDLSLPVITEKPVPPVVTRRKNQMVMKAEEFNSVGPESDQTPKCLSRRKRRIVRKRFDRVYSQHREDGQGEPSITEEDKKASSDADVEDNDEIGIDDRKAEITESGYCSDKLTNSPTETHDVLEYPNSLNEMVPDSTTVTQKLSELKLEEPPPVQQDDKLTQKLSELKLEEPPVQQLDDKQNLYLLRPESGLGSSIVSVQESNVSVLGPTELTHSIDSSDSIKGNPSFTSRDLSTESLPEIGLPSRDDSVSSEHDDNNTAQVCDSLSGSCFTDRILQQDYDPDATDVEVKTSIINDEDTKQGVVISDCQEELLDNNELSIINQKGKSTTRLEYSNQVARSSPVEIACNHILDSNLLSKSLESYKTECLSSVQNGSVDITGTSEMSPVHVGERNLKNSENNKSCVEETNQEMGFVLVGGITSSANCDLSVSVSKSVDLESCSKKQNETRPTSGCSKPNIVVSNGNDEESDVVNPELYRHRHITLAPRYQCFEGECSVLSCLNHFTAIEMMAGNNKVGCEACTQRQNKGCKDKEAKTVYRLSTKRLLISSPPQVLILHLKRFQVHQYSFKKLNCHVSFPLVLDIAPFCSHSVQKLLHPGQTQLLYSLYGIVSHSGTLRCGHYVAYVKVRTGPSEHGNPSPGKWFYVSDSHTREISVEAVLNTQAYLLFYERIE